MFSDDGSKNASWLTTVYKPTFATAALSLIKALHSLWNSLCCSVSVPSPGRPAGNLVCGTPHKTLLTEVISMQYTVC